MNSIRDMLAFSRFSYLWDLDETQELSEMLLGKWKWLLGQNHLVPHDTPMTCSKCVVEDCYKFADDLIELVNAKDPMQEPQSTEDISGQRQETPESK